ncbi:MAG TPA: DUF5684 domain-containing protein [Thermoanaerobaculia bacterium]|nr:DUF5684 domain-containing protein [Thermoanaerobaculia bacterium]
MLGATVGFLASTGTGYEGSGAGGAIGGVMMLVWLAIMVLVIAGIWKTFVKAGEPGWASIVPIYNLIVLLKIAGRPLWWFVLLLIPIVNIVVAFIVAIDLARKFGQGTGFGIGLALLPMIFYPVLGFGSSTYRG